MLIVLVIFLILLNAVFVMSEMAMVSARKGRLKARADKGSKGAAAAIALIDHPTRLLSTVQIGITLISILLGAVGEPAIAERLEKWLVNYPKLAPYAEWISFGVMIVLLTYISLVVGELVPKRLALAHAESMASGFARPMRMLSKLAAPLVVLLTFSTELILKIVPARSANTVDQGAEDEVRAILQTGTEEGVFHASEQQLVERVFKLGDQRVKQLMVPRTDIAYLHVDDTPPRIKVALAASSHSHLPVVKTDLDDLVGYVHLKDLVKAGLVDDKIELASIVRKPLFVPENSTAIKALDLFRREGVHIAFVLDEYGGLVGLITLNDILGSLLGELVPTGQHVEPMVVKRNDGSFLLDGMLSVDELQSLMGVEALPKRELGDFDTLGGFVMTYLARIPHTGDTFGFDRFQFEIVDMDRTRVDKVILTITPTSESAEKPA